MESTKFISYIPPTSVVKLMQYSGLGTNTGMSFLCTKDLSEIKNGELNLDFKVVIKTVGVVGCKLKINKIKCKIELLGALGHWFRVLRHSTCPRVFYLALGRMTYGHFPNRLFIWH